MQDFEKAITDLLNQVRLENNKSSFQLHLNNSLKKYFEYEGELHLRKLVSELIEEKLKLFERCFSTPIDYKSEIPLDVKEACKFLRISRASLYNQKKNPHFPKPRRVGRRVIYSKNSLIEYLNKVKSYVREPP